MFRPSEAALSGSINRYVTKCYSTFRSQKRRQETIPELPSMFLEFLNAAKSQKAVFERIIIIRDGVGENQFSSICEQEFLDMKSALAQHPDYSKVQTKICYLVAQKRNLCRLGTPVPNGTERLLVNPPPGTCLDNTITGPESSDFYLIGHKAIQGSPRPVHFWVFRDEIKIPKDQLQNMLFQLCHLHPGCTKSVSLPSPLYYAHKLAYRVGQVYRPAFEMEQEELSQKSNDSNEDAKIIIPDSIKFTPFFL